MYERDCECSCHCNAHTTDVVECAMCNEAAKYMCADCASANQYEHRRNRTWEVCDNEACRVLATIVN